MYSVLRHYMKFVYVEYVTSNGFYAGAKRILFPHMRFIIYSYITEKFVLNLRRYSYYVTNMYESNYMQYQTKRNGCYIRLQIFSCFKK